MSLSDEIRAKVDEAEGRLEASTDASPLPRTVLDLHRPDTENKRFADSETCATCGETSCCYEDWPCPTILSLAKAWGL